MSSELTAGKRLYINITNRCNTDCPFCCMYSGTENTKDMVFPVYQKIIDGCEKEFELQLEGGEPLVHPYLYLFLEYAIATGKCKKVIILTNGFSLERHLKRLIDLSNFYSIPFVIKISVNYWLIGQDPDHLKKIHRWVFSTKYLPFFSILCNVRLRKQKDKDLVNEIQEDSLLREHSNIFYLQSYGRLSGNEAYEKPVIVQNIEEWELYATDGTSFGQNLIGRSEHEHN